MASEHREFDDKRVVIKGTNGRVFVPFKAFSEAVAVMPISMNRPITSSEAEILQRHIQFMSEQGFKQVNIVITDALQESNICYNFPDKDPAKYPEGSAERKNALVALRKEAFQKGMNFFKQYLLPVLIGIHNSNITSHPNKPFNLTISTWHREIYDGFTHLPALHDVIFKSGEIASLETVLQGLAVWEQDEIAIFENPELKPNASYNSYYQHVVEQAQCNDRAKKPIADTIHNTRSRFRNAESERVLNAALMQGTMSSTSTAHSPEVAAHDEATQQRREMHLRNFIYAEVAELLRWIEEGRCDYTVYRGELLEAMQYFVQSYIDANRFAHLELKFAPREKARRPASFPDVAAADPTDGLLPGHRSAPGSLAVSPSQSPPGSPTKKPAARNNGKVEAAPARPAAASYSYAPSVPFPSPSIAYPTAAPVMSGAYDWNSVMAKLEDLQASAMRSANGDPTLALGYLEIYSRFLGVAGAPIQPSLYPPAASWVQPQFVPNYASPGFLSPMAAPAAAQMQPQLYVPPPPAPAAPRSSVGMQSGFFTPPHHLAFGTSPIPVPTGASRVPPVGGTGLPPTGTP